DPALRAAPRSGRPDPVVVPAGARPGTDRAGGRGPGAVRGELLDLPRPSGRGLGERTIAARGGPGCGGLHAQHGADAARRSGGPTDTATAEVRPPGDRRDRRLPDGDRSGRPRDPRGRPPGRCPAPRGAGVPEQLLGLSRGRRDRRLGRRRRRPGVAAGGDQIDGVEDVRRATLVAAVSLGAATLAALGLFVVYIAGGQPQVEGALLFVALAGLGAGLMVWATRLMPGIGQ